MDWLGFYFHFGANNKHLASVQVLQLQLPSVNVYVDDCRLLSNFLLVNNAIVPVVGKRWMMKNVVRNVWENGSSLASRTSAHVTKKELDSIRLLNFDVIQPKVDPVDARLDF